MSRDNYHYTVPLLLRDAGRHRRSDHFDPRLEDDHVIELRLVVEALNRVPQGTYTGINWQSRLVDCFNAKHRNEEQLPHNVHLRKTRAVDKWIRGEHLSDDEMKWIDMIRDAWKRSQNELEGFDEFKAELSSVLGMSRRSWLRYIVGLTLLCLMFIIIYVMLRAKVLGPID